MFSPAVLCFRNGKWSDDIGGGAGDRACIACDRCGGAVSLPAANDSCLSEAAACVLGGFSQHLFRVVIGGMGGGVGCRYGVDHYLGGSCNVVAKGNDRFRSVIEFLCR